MSYHRPVAIARQLGADEAPAVAPSAGGFPWGLLVIGAAIFGVVAVRHAREEAKNGPARRAASAAREDVAWKAIEDDNVRAAQARRGRYGFDQSDQEIRDIAADFVKRARHR